jgi:hypothetical protein
MRVSPNTPTSDQATTLIELINAISSMKRITVLLADNNWGVRSEFKNLLELETDF